MTETFTLDEHLARVEEELKKRVRDAANEGESSFWTGEVDWVKEKRKKFENLLGPPPAVVYPKDVETGGFTDAMFAYNTQLYNRMGNLSAENARWMFRVVDDTLKRTAGLDSTKDFQNGYKVYRGKTLKLRSATFPHYETSIAVPRGDLTLPELEEALLGFVQGLDAVLQQRGDPRMISCNVWGFKHDVGETFRVMLNDHHRSREALNFYYNGCDIGFVMESRLSMPALYQLAVYENKAPKDTANLTRAHLERLLASHEKGKTVYLSGLQSRPELNHGTAKVVSYDLWKDRYMVELANGEVISVKAGRASKPGFQFTFSCRVEHDYFYGEKVAIVENHLGVTAADDVVLFRGPRLVLKLDTEWCGDGPTPDAALAKDIVFELGTNELDVGTFRERLAATEPERRRAYGVENNLPSEMREWRLLPPAHTDCVCHWSYEVEASDEENDDA